ncbi:MAG: ATPase domain-containing protein [Acidobacteriota bacterium]
MKLACQLRDELELALAKRMPAALSPRMRVAPETWPTGVMDLDARLQGGLPVGAVTELVGPECSGRTTLALQFLAGCTQQGKVCAWVDVSDTFCPQMAEAAGVNLERLLWVRCGGPGAEAKARRPWKPLDQALRTVDLLLQAGGFGAIVLDMGSVAPEFAWRVPLATWFRFRAATERTQSCMLLLTQHPCARSSADLVLRMSSGIVEASGPVMTGVAWRAEIERNRNESAAKVILIRKPPQNEKAAAWTSSPSWMSGEAV